MKIIIEDASQMEEIGAKLAQVSPGGEIIYLEGQLGAGKTTLVRGFINAMGHKGKVKSPTYTLVEPYKLSNRDFYHFDLYRLNDPEELEAMGIRDYCDGKATCLIEWPERGVSVLAEPDLRIIIRHHDQGRQLELEECSDKAKSLLTHF